MMKAMEYKKNIEIKEIYFDTIDNYKALIVSYGLHPCAYIAIPKEHPYYEAEYDDINEIEVHGGFTYAKKEFPIVLENKEFNNTDWVLGWDYAHYGDYMGGYEGLIPDTNNGHKYTTNEIFEEILNVIEQLKGIEKNV